MTEKEFKELEVYCHNEKCGEGISCGDGKFKYTKRQMIFNRITSWNSYAEFRCPVCGKLRKFKNYTFGGGIYEIDIETIKSSQAHTNFNYKPNRNRNNNTLLIYMLPLFILTIIVVIIIIE